jgi:hypothetical protein
MTVVCASVAVNNPRAEPPASETTVDTAVRSFLRSAVKRIGDTSIAFVPVYTHPHRGCVTSHRKAGLRSTRKAAPRKAVPTLPLTAAILATASGSHQGHQSSLHDN